MLIKLNTKRKSFAITLIAILVFQLLVPIPSYALTNGPSQPEFSTFSAATSADMVDLFSGDLNYNIPLFDLPGPGGSYPFTLSYHSGISMDQEATWVGLGWSLNAGAITREMRGLPDEYKGDSIVTINDAKPNITWDFGIASDIELISKPKTKQDSSTTLTIGTHFSHNTYTGWDAGFNLGLNVHPFNMKSFGFSGSLATSAVEGASLSTGFSYAIESQKAINSYDLGTTVSSRDGLMGLNLGYSHYNHDLSEKNSKLSESELKAKSIWNSGWNNSSNLSFEKRSFIPANEVRYTGGSYSASVEIGALLAIPHVGGRVNVGYSRQEIDRRGRPVVYKGYGYMNAKKRISGDTYLMDLNRTGEGPLHKFTQNLAIPITTPDLFMMTGGGMNSKFRGYRSDVGIYSDPNISSLFTSGNLGFDINPTGYIDVGVNVGAQVVKSSNPIFPVSGKKVEKFNFTTDSINSNYRSFFFKIPGEPAFDSLHAYDFISKDSPVRISLNNTEVETNTKLESENLNSTSIESGSRTSRKPHGTSIQYITNKELLTENGLSRPEFTVWVHNPERVQLDRSSDSLHHIAGFEVVNQDGNRYIYGLPVKNIKHHEYVFSVTHPINNCTDTVSVDAIGDGVNYHVPHSDEYYQQKNLSQYNTSHLLTAILGQDYQDVDDTLGPSDGDLGFWVRFEYAKTTDYAWRSPYKGANYIEGSYVSTRDDKGSFLFGVREQYYLVSAETRSHYCEFVLADRADSKGARSEFAGTGSTQGSCKKLKEIRLYSKFDKPFEPQKALKIIHFGYNYSLCNGALNSSSGKLMLDSLFFSYDQSIEGYSTPYLFEYGSNQNYNSANQDRWGRYQNNENACLAREFPYTNQDSIEANENARAWNLNKVTLPSGAQIDIAFESDDYLYVQDEEAMQMFKVNRVGSSGAPTIIEDRQGESFKVYFDPGITPINTPEDVIPFMKSIHGLLLDENGNIVDSQQSQVFFKIRMLIAQGKYDYISGYAQIVGFGADDLGGEYLKPYVELGHFELAGRHYHPFCAAAWQKMKLEYPSIISHADFEDDNQSFKEVMGLFAASLGEIKNLYRSFFSACDREGFASVIDTQLSFIRLTYPGTHKYGGDSRVKQISLNDNWGGPVTLGQTYAYTMLDSIRGEISSGVAENEPAVGYEECPLRYAKIYGKEIPVLTSANLLFEYPINEAYLPAANIGYRQVTVKSLATSLQQNNDLDLPENFSTTGKVVHEFYTAKDFPVIAKETSIRKHNPDSPLWNSLFSFIQKQQYTGSQGYSVSLNDMHGKPHRVTSYGEDKMNREQETIISKTEYTYYEGPTGIRQELGKYYSYHTLNNQIPVLLDYGPDPQDSTKLHVQNMEVGVDREFISDLREMSTIGLGAKVGPNLVLSVLITIFSIPLPLAGSFLNVEKTENRTKTVVTNKVISTSGILKQIDVYDGQSHLRTNQLVFDKITGQPVLTSVNNAFDHKIYSLNIPAHYAYDGMSEAYQNYRLSFDASLDNDECSGGYRLNDISTKVLPSLKVDDELLVMQEDEAMGLLNLTTVAGSDVLGISTLDLSSGSYEFLVLRSGAANILSSSAINITSLTDPTQNIVIQNSSASVPTVSGATTAPLSIMIIDSVINAQAVTYHKTASLEAGACPITPIPATCTCISATIPCDGDCTGLAHLMISTPGYDTLIIKFFNCTAYPSYDIDFGCFDIPPGASFMLSLEPHHPEESDCDFESANAELHFDSCTSPLLESQMPFMGTSPMGRHWSEMANYTYVTQRSGYNRDRGVELDIAKEGAVDSVPLFNFSNAMFPIADEGTKWIATQTSILNTVESNRQESLDAIGVSSSLLLGYPGPNLEPTSSNQPILLATNATPEEIAFEGFEEDNWVNDNPPTYHITTGKFTLAYDMMSFRYEKYTILGALSGSPEHIGVNKQYDETDPVPEYILLDLNDTEGKSRYIQVCDVLDTDSIPLSDFDEEYISPYRNGTEYEIIWPELCSELSFPSTGRAVLIFTPDSPIAASSAIGTRNSEFAHTGTYSFFPSNENGRQQTQINLVSGKKYVFEGWIRVPGLLPVYSYPDQSYVSIIDGTNVFDAKPTGEIIEGWQQIRCTFIPEGYFIYMSFHRVEDQDVYFDDIRLSPLEAKVKSYVYDPNKLRLLAELDENNYATLYSYDEEGKLILVRKETERGIMTIQESRSHLHPN